MCKNVGAIGSGAAEGRRKTSLRDPNFFVHTTTHDLTHFPSADFHEIFARTRGSSGVARILSLQEGHGVRVHEIRQKFIHEKIINW